MGENQMRQANKIIGIMVSLLLCCTSFTGFTQEMRTMETRIADILAQFPASTPGVKNKLAEEIIDLGPTGIMEICKMVTAPGKTDDTTVRYALNGLAIYAARPGANEQQKVVSKTFIMALEPNLHHEVKAFLIRQLQIVGKGEAIKPLSTFLQDQKLCEPATQAMLTIGTEEAEKMFLKHLSSVKDANRITLIKALGELRCRKAVKKLTGYAENEDRNTRLVAIWAIANIGDKSARKILARYMPGEEQRPVRSMNALRFAAI
jgi:HEAT repeat protein